MSYLSTISLLSASTTMITTLVGLAGLGLACAGPDCRPAAATAKAAPAAKIESR